MADSKQDVIDMLNELSELTKLDEGDPQSFRVRAYESAAQSIAAQASDLGTLTVKQLQGIEGIGKSTAEKIRELLETGKVAKLEALRQKHPPAVVALEEMRTRKPDDPRVEAYGRLLYDQAVIAEGSRIKDPAAFAKRVNELIAGAAAAAK